MTGRGVATLTAARATGPEKLVPRAFLFRVLDCQRLLGASARHALDDTDEVVLGRGDGATERKGRSLRIWVSDSYVSSRHATLTRGDGRWRLTDLSKNGTFRNGIRVSGQTDLRDGDVVEVGGTFFIFRDALPARASDLADLVSDALRPPADGLATLVPELALRFGQIERIARSPVAVVLRGETGTGKEVVARAIHALSRRKGAFIAVNCGALPETLLESELFGYRKGAFSGATEDRPGLVRSSDRGTLLLDEVGDLPLASQAAFLRVIQEREVLPVGGAKAVAVDLRVLSASHHDLHALVAARSFRADLEARLTGVEIDLPPLRERREDLGILLAAILRRVFPDLAAGVVLDVSVARAFLNHAWPKNVRELEQALTSAAVIAGGMPIALGHLPPSFRDGTAHTKTVPIEKLAEPVERDGDPELRVALVGHLEEHGGNLSAVARAMGKPRKQVQRWVKRLGLDAASFKGRV